MDEKFTDLAVHLQEVDSRSKSNEHRINAHEKELHELRDKQDAIYELTSSVKSIATDMTYIKEDVKEVKTGQDKLNQKVTDLENKPANEAKKRIDNIGDKLLWLFIGGVAASLLCTILPNIPW
jgi:septal ring factor EnvC (AmiA/AmiB activator)